MEKTESIEEARAFLMSVEELAALLHKSPATVRSDVHRRPMGLPPRYKLPGMKRIFLNGARSWNGWTLIYKRNLSL